MTAGTFSTSPTRRTACPLPLDTDAATALRVELARRDINSFVEFVLRTEDRKHAPFRQSACHRTWHAICDRHDLLVLEAAYGLGKSWQLVVGRTLHALGLDPSKRVLLVSRTEPQASRWVRACARYIERSRELHAVFPGLELESSNEKSFTLKKGPISKDPSMQGIGMGSNPQGNRSELIILDDILSWQSTRSQEQRDRTADWVTSEVLTRVPPGGGGKILLVGIPWHPDDIFSRWVQQGWPVYAFPIEKPDFTPQWPEGWTPAEIDTERRKLGVHAASMLDLAPRSDGSSMFQRSWIDGALVAGAGRPLKPGLAVLGAKTFTGVDVAFGTTGDLCAIVTIHARPDGKRELLWVESGHWPLDVLEQKVINAHFHFGSRVTVEVNGGAGFLVDTVGRHASIPITRYVTSAGEKSMEWQASLLGSEMAEGKWVIPSTAGRPNHPEVHALVRDLLNFTSSGSPRGSSGHGDRLSALLLARWGCANAGANQAGYFDRSGIGRPGTNPWMRR